MNTIYKIFLSSFLLFMVACNDLEVPPINILQDKDVFASESGVTSYMMRLYEELPIEDFNFNKNNGFNQFENYPGLSAITGEMLLCTQDMIWDSPSGDWWQAWKYGSVRNTNYFINEFPQYNAGLSPEFSQTCLGEAYFIRAYYYFAMVKRYGGVPIVKTVQNYPAQGIEELKVLRNSEQEVYDFIAEDLDEAIKLLPDNTSLSGRVNKNIALAFKSRAMLYAGSIAQYGKIQLNGLLGIPSEKALHYYQAAHTAAKSLETKYALYEKYTDKYENYWQLFLDPNSSENIFVKNYRYPEKTHSYDLCHIPYQMRGAQGYSSRFNPTLDFVEMFDDINGLPGSLNVGTEANPTRFANRIDLFSNVEPRLRASVILPGDQFKGEIIDIQKGLYPSYSPTADPLTSADFNATYNGKNIIGKSGMGPGETTSTGFLIRKYQDPSLTKSQVGTWRSAQAWIDIRYAEILLNRAEAAFQIANVDDALACINKIRNRAGAKIYKKDQLTAKLIQKERRMELAFENHTYWDLRRWRIADTEINNRQFKALYPYYVIDEGKYIYKKAFVGPNYTFDTKVNYVKIPTSEIAKNDKLEQNPGY